MLISTIYTIIHKTMCLTCTTILNLVACSTVTIYTEKSGTQTGKPNISHL